MKIQQLQNPDISVAQRVWITETGLGQAENGKITFGCRVSCSTRSDDFTLERSIPVLVRNIVQDLPAELDGRRITTSPWFISSDDDVTDLIDLLNNPRRRCDVIVISLPENSSDVREAIISAPELALKTLGVAHTVVLTGPASYILSDRIGKDFSVYRQAIRTYRPNFDSEGDAPLDHPLILAESVSSWREGGAIAYQRHLVSQMLRQSILPKDIEKLQPTFAEVRRVETEISREAARVTGISSDDLLVIAESEIKDLRDDLAKQKLFYDNLMQVAQEEKEQALGELLRVRSLNQNYRKHLESVQKQLAETANETPEIPIPETMDGFEEWCDKYLIGNVELHPRAYRGAKKSEYEDCTLIYRALLLLKDYYVPMRRTGEPELTQKYRAQCLELGIEETPSFSGEGWAEQGKDYLVSFGGKTRLLNLHLKKGKSREPRYCFRLYFFWDEENEQVVVGWLTSHLDTAAT